MIIPVQTAILKYAAMNCIIAPHGITDIIHAQKHNLFRQLFVINGVTILSTVLLDKLHFTHFLDASFIITSIIHFRRDFPIKTLIPRYVFSSIFLFICIFYHSNLLFFYMLWIHVPNHYRMNWKYLKDKKPQTISLLCISTTFLYMTEFDFDVFAITSIVKGIIISHIIYEEYFVFTSSKNRNDIMVM